MEIPFEQVRVLGALIEKERSTPDYYPLTLNSLTTACNQKSNRDPVSSLSETEVQVALDELHRHRLVGHVTGAASRAVKYRHAVAEAWSLGAPERSVLAVLMLRGPQTVGEIRSRSGRMHDFASLAEVESVLGDLASRAEPLVVALPRQPGHKEARYAHLLSGEPDPAPPGSGPTDRLGMLEAEVTGLKSELDRLREAFETFRDAFR